MIEKLTKQKMVEFGFDKEQIEKLLTWDNYEINIVNNKGFYYASNIENKIYSETDAYTKCYFKDETKPEFPFNDFDLVPKYFELLTANYIAERKKEAKITFNEKKAIEQLKQIEIEKVTALIEGFKRENNRATYHKRKIDKYNDYLVWLQSLDIEDFVERKIKTTPSLESIFISTNNSYQLCLELLEDLQLTIDGVPNIKKGRIGKLTGLITALKETPNILKGYKHTNDFLLQVFNTHLKSNFKTFSKRNEDFNESHDDAKKHLKKYISNKK
jgi:hypothetical protein